MWRQTSAGRDLTPQRENPTTVSAAMTINLKAEAVLDAEIHLRKMPSVLLLREPHRIFVTGAIP